LAWGIAQLFIKEGTKVVFSDINKSGKAAAGAAGKNALFIECDISNIESVKNLVAKTLVLVLVCLAFVDYLG
jgi:NAD(P)-dependent dehydrogenase (short-subunit alcohol dehydrogenase family)